MSNHGKSINALVKVPQLLELLNCRTRLHGLPLRTRCPVCRAGVLTIYRDHVSRGGWHSCQACDSRGDLIALTAAALTLSIAEAIAFLAARGFPLPTDEGAARQYLEEHVEYDRRLMQLWQAAKKGHRRSPPEFTGLAHKLGLNPQDWPARWPEGIGQCLAAMTKTSIERAFAPQVMANAVARGLTGSTSSSRVFYGEDWDVVAAVPFFDLPGRIATYLFVGREADLNKDVVLKRANRGTRGNQHVRVDAEAGLAFHPGVFAAAELHDRTVLAVHDPFLMLKLQARHLRTHANALPIIAWLDTDQWRNWDTLGRRTRTSTAWQMMAGCRTVFWCPAGTIDVHTLRQAIATDGWISTAGPRVPTADAFKEYLWKRPPYELWRHVVEQARPWPAALGKDLGKRRDYVIDQWLVQLESEHEPLEPILARCDAIFRERITRAVNAAEWPRTIEFDGRTIVESNRSWSLQQNGRPGGEICDAILRIDQVTSGQGGPTVRGRVLYGLHEIPFQTPLKALEKDPMNYMRDVILDEGLGLLRCDHRYSKHVLHIALSFQPQQQSEPLRRVGFDVGTETLVLPDYTVELGGAIRPTTAIVIADHTPATSLSAPVGAPELPLDELAACPEMAKTVWATTACVVANILATQIGERPTSTCLVGSGATQVGMTVAEALGCRRVTISSSSDVEQALKVEQIHGWPIVITAGPKLRDAQMKNLFAAERDESRCFIAASRLVSRLMLLHGWNVIDAAEKLTAPEVVLQWASRFLPAYLQNLMGRWCYVKGDSKLDGLPLRVLDDMAAYADDHGANPDAITAAGELLRIGEHVDHAELLLVVVGALVAAGKLRLTLAPDERGAPTIIDNPAADSLLLPPATLIAALHMVPAPVLSESRMQKLLAESGLATMAHRGGWLLRRAAVIDIWRQHDVVPDEALRNCG